MSFVTEKLVSIKLLIFPDFIFSCFHCVCGEKRLEKKLTYLFFHFSPVSFLFHFYPNQIVENNFPYYFFPSFTSNQIQHKGNQEMS